MLEPLSLKVLHKKSTSKSFTWLHVERQKCFNDCPISCNNCPSRCNHCPARFNDCPVRFTILWERNRNPVNTKNTNNVIESIHVGDVIDVSNFESYLWKRPDLVYFPVNTDAKLKSVWRDSQSTPFIPIPPPPKNFSKDTSQSRNIEMEYCKYWIHARQCPFANQETQCLRLHPLGEELKRIRDEWVAAKKLYRKSMAHIDDPHRDSKTSKASKAKVFAEFLAITYNLSSDSFLLDIAAGR